MRKNHILRYILIGIPLLIVCLFLVVIVVINTNTFRNFVRSEISEQAAQRLGARVDVASVDTHWTRLGIDLNNIVIYSHTNPARGETPLAQADRLEVGIHFLPLLHGRFELRELILDRPIVRLVIDSQGRSNLPKPPHPSASSNGPDEIFNLEIGNCAIHSGDIYYNDAQTPLDAELHDLKFQTGYGLLSGQYKGTLSYDNGRLVARQFAPVSHAVQLQFTATRSGLSLDPLVLTTSASRITLNAQLTNYASPRITGAYEGNISTQEIADILRSPGLPIGNVALSGNLAYQTSAEPFIATVSLQGQIRSDRLALRTAQRPINATAVSAAYQLKGATLQVQNLAADILGGHVRANWQMQHVDAAVSPSRLDASLQGVSLATASDTLAPPNVQKVRFQGTTNLQVQASWSGSLANAIAHARLTIASRPQSATPRAIPVNGLVRLDYNGPQNTIAVGQSYLQTANTKLALSGTLSSQRAGNSALNVTATTTDLSETASLATIIQNALDPSANAARIPALGGSATLAAHVTGAARDPRIEGQLSAQNLSVDASHWRSLALSINANSSQATIQNGVLAGAGPERINFSGKVGLQNWSLVDTSPVQVQASVADMPAATIQQIAHLNYPVSGILSAQVNVNGTKASPDGKATLTVAKASAWNQPIDNLAINAESHQGAIHSTLNLQIPAGTLSADASYTLASQQYDVKLHATGIKLEKIAALQQRTSVQGTADLSASGTGTIHDPQLQVNFTVPQLQAQGQTISNISAQATIANQHANFTLQSVVYQGSVQAKGDVALTGDHQATATLDVRALPIAAVAANFLPSEGSKLGGQTEIHASVSGPLKTPVQMQARLEIPTLSVSYGKVQLALSRPLLADYRNGTLTIAPTQIQGTGTSLTFGGTVPIKSAAAYTLVADGTMDLGVLQQFAPGMKSSGQMDIHVHSAGRSSGMQGQFQIKNAVFTTETLPVGIEGLNAQINLSGTRADIANFSGTVGGGKVSATGFATFGHQSAFNVALNAQSVRIRYPEGLRSVLSGQINLHGSPGASSLTGRVVVDNLSFTQDFDLANFAGYFSEDSSGGPPSAFESNMSLGIAVQSSQDINLASSKLSVGGSANLNVAGTLAQPVVLGRIALSSGEMFFLGKRFQVQSGTISFANPARSEPVLAVYITTTVEQYNLTLNLNGPIDRLRTSYTSDPALSSADIIHLLAFGNTNAEAGAQPSQSATMGAESVLAQQAGSQLAGKLENITGISQIILDPLATNSSGDPGAQIAIQERVTGSLLFTFSTNVTSTQSEAVQLQYDLNKRWSVTGLRDQNGGYGLTLRLHKVF